MHARGRRVAQRGTTPLVDEHERVDLLLRPSLAVAGGEADERRTGGRRCEEVFQHFHNHKDKTGFIADYFIAALFQSTLAAEKPQKM